MPDEDLSRQVAAKWVEIAPLVDRLMERIGDPREFPIMPGSALVGDDRASEPYQVSHAAQACLSAAVDHLHAAKTLAYDSGILHLAAPATLARGVIENAATGLWILTPGSRDERVRRVLKWHARNAHDQVGAGFVPTGRTKGHYLDSISSVAVRRNLDPLSVRGGYQILKVIRAVVTEHPDLAGIVTAWQLGSGFAHGRPWAYLGALQQEHVGSPAPGVADVRLTNDSTLALYPILNGLFAVERLLQVREKRAGIQRMGVESRQPGNASQNACAQLVVDPEDPLVVDRDVGVPKATPTVPAAEMGDQGGMGRDLDPDRGEASGCAPIRD